MPRWFNTGAALVAKKPFGGILMNANDRFELNKGLVRFVINDVLFGSAVRAAQVAHKIGMELCDFDQTASLALWHCCLNFEGPDKAFSTYAVKTLKFSILDLIRRKSSIIKYGDDIKERASVTSIELAITEDGSSLHEIIPSGEDVESEVIQKVTLEERLSVLNENERNVIYLGIQGVSKQAIIYKFGYTVPRFDYYRRKALKKLNIPSSRKAV